MKKLLTILALLPVLAQAQVGVLNISRVADQPVGPGISATPTSINFTNVTGTASNSRTVSYSFSSLAGSSGQYAIPSWLELSTNGGTSYVAGPITGLGNGSGSFLLRVKASTAAGSYTGYVIFQATGATPDTIVVTATTGAITLTSSRGSLSLNATAGIAGTVDSTSLIYSNLSGNISVVVPSTPEPVEVSMDKSTWSTGTVSISTTTYPSPATLYARVTSGGTVGSTGDSLRISATGVSTVKIPLTGTVSATANVVARFSFSATSHTCTGWTNVPGDPHTAIRTATDPIMGITLTSVATANWVPNGSCAFDNTGNFSTSVITDCNGSSSSPMYSTWINGAQYDHTKPSIILGGFDPSKSYNIMWSGTTSNGSQRISCGYVEGATLSSLQKFVSKNNTTLSNLFSNITPASDGTIKMWVNADVSVPEQAQFAACIITGN